MGFGLMRSWKRAGLLMVGLSGITFCQAQKVIPLYYGTIPNSKKTTNEQYSTAHAAVDSLTFKVSVPTLSVFLPPKEKANGTAVIICPGGGYHVLLTKREGTDVAKEFNKLGVTAFVLKYRLPDDKVLIDKTIGPLQDAQQAIRLVRERAGEWNIDPSKIGIMGFSAGGHLAATAGTHFAVSQIGLVKTSLRPDFMILINPVISFTNEIGHIGSRDNLLGTSPSAEKMTLFSNELQITPQTPPAYLVHSGADEVVPVANSVEFYKALVKNGVSGELHVYSKGEHGFLTYPSFQEWFDRVVGWMRSGELLR
jgi:acetyl esterase/lipase